MGLKYWDKHVHYIFEMVENSVQSGKNELSTVAFAPVSTMFSEVLIPEPKLIVNYLLLLTRTLQKKY